MDFLFAQGNKPIKEEDESMIRKIVDGMNVWRKWYTTHTRERQYKLIVGCQVYRKMEA
jgi:hypothetical protein